MAHAYYESPRALQRRQVESAEIIFAYLDRCERMRFRTENHRVLEPVKP